MPMRDGTGPMGTGPIGQKLGPCGVNETNLENNENAIQAQGGFLAGFGRRLAGLFGRGRGRRGGMGRGQGGGRGFFGGARGKGRGAGKGGGRGRW